MARYRSNQLKFALIFIAAIAIFLFLYVQWLAFRFTVDYATLESKFLADFSDRSISRVHANPQWFIGDQRPSGKALGSPRLQLLLSYEALVNEFPDIKPLDQMQHNKLFVHTLKIHGPLKMPDFVMVKPVFLANGEQYFGYLRVTSELTEEKIHQHLVAELQPALFIALGSIVLMFLLQLREIYSLNTTAMAMADWADNLSTASSARPPPNFQLPRLNHIAFTINKSLATFNQVLEKEQSFARYTSHELRTPVAALSANIELLEMMMKDLSPRERQVLQRMETAVSDMKYQMDALLWMSREAEIDAEMHPCNVFDMVNKSTKDNAYLLAGKRVTTVISPSEVVVLTHPVLFQIVLNNLVRNAYQNTFHGFVDITIHPQGLTILNKNDGANAAEHKEQSFGIGLILVQKLVQKLHLLFEISPIEDGCKVRLLFANQTQV